MHFVGLFFLQYIVVLTAFCFTHYSHFYAFTNRRKNVRQRVTSLLLHMSWLTALWYSDLNLLVSAHLARVAVCACNKLEQVFMVGPVSCKVTWLCVVLNKREWVWVGGGGCRGWNEAWSYCYGCLQVQSNPLSVSFLFACSCMCVVFFSWGGRGVLCVSALCEPTLNIPARKAGSDTSYYSTNEGCQFSSFIYGRMESRSGVENPCRYKPLYGRQSVEKPTAAAHCMWLTSTG